MLVTWCGHAGHDLGAGSGGQPLEAFCESSAAVGGTAGLDEVDRRWGAALASVQFELHRLVGSVLEADHPPARRCQSIDDAELSAHRSKSVRGRDVHQRTSPQRREEVDGPDAGPQQVADLRLWPPAGLERSPVRGGTPVGIDSPRVGTGGQQPGHQVVALSVYCYVEGG